ncbi:MAG: GrpB family protein [Candidatus Aenigmarchaeota archaeon]|nr:GrpB family protein [Candidatus Aenigmarchaeota archaeon]
MQKYVFRKHSGEYKKFYEKERRKLKKLLGFSVKIEHVGSTAIEGLGGKPLVDILIGVSNLEKSRKKLEEAGYRFGENGSTKERLVFGFDYPYKNRKRRVHLHVTKSGSKDWKEIIAFRDYLMQHPEAVRKYEKIKKEGVKKARGDGEAYRNYKKKFIKNIVRRALRERHKRFVRNAVQDDFVILAVSLCNIFLSPKSLSFP